MREKVICVFTLLFHCLNYCCNGKKEGGKQGDLGFQIARRETEFFLECGGEKAQLIEAYLLANL